VCMNVYLYTFFFFSQSVPDSSPPDFPPPPPLVAKTDVGWWFCFATGPCGLETFLADY
jgi:hypothetical protein